MSSSRRRLNLIALTLFFACLMAGHHAAAAGKQTLTGELGDAMCGPKHMEPDPAACTRTCVSHGSKYALVVGDNVYVLNTDDKAILASLSQQAGKKVSITGTVNGVAIDVSSVAPAK
jgi:hypothetical protein